MKLYNYWRSSTSYRTRIALNLKGLAYEYVPINLLKNEQDDPAFLKLNPSGGVPALVLDNGAALTQSLAIMDYLEQTHPTPLLLPRDPLARVRVLRIAYAVATDMHQFANLPVLNYIGEKLGDTAKNEWVQYWFPPNLAAIEAILNDGHSGKFCHGDAPSWADICLIPQLFTARRFNVDLTPYPGIARIEQAALAHPAFAAAHPEKQPDAPG